MKRLVFVSAVSVVLSAATPALPQSAGAAPGVGCGVVYFDLGNTLVDTSDRAHLKFMAGAADYLETLRNRGAKVGLITNVPPSWGSTDAERAAAVRTSIDAAWTDPEPFPWRDFGDLIFTPRTDAESKPAPDLFARAREAAAECPVIFEGENPAEIRTASAEDFAAYQVFREDAPEFLPPAFVWRILGK